MNEIELLVRDLYSKYAPNDFSEDKISYVKENYKNPEDFAKDFYGKYAPEEYSEDKMKYIRDNYLSTTTTSEEVDLGKSEAVQDAAPVTAKVEAEDTDSTLESGLSESQSEYLINDKKVERSYLNEKLNDSEFIEGLKDGKINVSVKLWICLR